MSNKKNQKKSEVKENSIPEVRANIPQDEGSMAQKQEDTPPFEESLEYFGQIIRETRVSNNLSLESVSGHLHISVKILKAIEDGKPENGPTPVFFRGLVRTYCHFLELDKINIINKLDNLLKDNDSEENINTKTLKPVFSMKDSHSNRNILTIIAILICGYLLYYLYFTQKTIDNVSDNTTQTKKETEQLNSKFASNQDTIQNIQGAESINKIIPNTMLEQENNSPKVKNQNKINKNISSTFQQSNFEPLTLEIEASKATWVSVAVDNNDIQDFRIGTDEIQQWVAKNKFILTIGNTKAVRVLLNGREIETNRNHDLLSNWIVDKSFLP